MDQAETIQLWGVLENGTQLQERLEALGNLEVFLTPHDEDAIRRLGKIKLFSSGPLAEAVVRCMVRMRRKRFFSDVLSSSATLDEFRSTGKTDLAKQALRDPSAVVRYDFLVQVEEEELFEVAPVLGNQLLREKEPKLLALLARILGRLGTERYMLPLKRVSRHEDARVRLGAIEGMAYQVGPERNQVLIERLGDPDKAIREQARRILAATPIREILDVVERIPPGRMSQVRRRVVPLFFQDLENRRVRTYLYALLLDSDPQVSSEALLALARIGDPRAEARMADLAADPDPRIQQVLRMARAAMAGAPPPSQTTSLISPPPM